MCSTGNRHFGFNIPCAALQRTQTQKSTTVPLQDCCALTLWFLYVAAKSLQTEISSFDLNHRPAGYVFSVHKASEAVKIACQNSCTCCWTDLATAHAPCHKGARG